MGEQIYQIGMAEIKVASGSGKIVTLGLGSCIAICGYDPRLQIAGMVHLMLPTCPETGPYNPAKFGNTAVPLLVEEMRKLGANRNRIWLKIVGGAHMFSFGSKDSSINIGVRNVQSVEEACGKMGMTIIAQNVGGSMGRSVYMDVANGLIEVKTINKGIVHL